MRKRQGFTLVELLVAVALIFFIMSILTTAFLYSSKAFTDLKAEGDLAEKLRVASNLMRKYLAADHFEGKRRLSDPSFWANGPPQEGFFRIYQGTRSSGPFAAPPYPPYVIEGTDTNINGLPSLRATNHAVHFAVKLRGNNVSDFFSAGIPAGTSQLALGTPEFRYQPVPLATTYTAQWAEMAFFLQPLQYSGTEDVTANGTPLYGLYMRQLLAVPDNNATQVQIAGGPATVPEISGTVSGANLNCNCPRDLTQPARRFGMSAGNLSGIVSGAITAATNASPIQITSANHLLATGQPISISGVGGNTSANGIWIVTVVDVNNFTLNGSTGNAAYTAGGTWAKWYTTLAQDAPGNTALLGSDLLLTNVVSFEVRVMLAGGSDFVDLYDPTVTGLSNGNTSLPTATGPMVLDTWSSVKDDVNDYSNWSLPGTDPVTTLPNPAAIPLWSNGTGPVIKAIQITLRVWDEKTENTRQITFAVPL